MTSLRGKKAYVDASIAIYALEKLHEFPNLKAGFLDLLDRAEMVALTSEMTLLETVVGSRKRNDALVEAEFRRFLTPSPVMLIRPVDTAVLERAIDLRVLGLKTPDAIHVATGMLEGCDVFLTRDRDWARVRKTSHSPALGSGQTPCRGRESPGRSGLRRLRRRCGPSVFDRDDQAAKVGLTRNFGAGRHKKGRSGVF